MSGRPIVILVHDYDGPTTYGVWFFVKTPLSFPDSVTLSPKNSENGHHSTLPYVHVPLSD